MSKVIAIIDTAPCEACGEEVRDSESYSIFVEAFKGDKSIYLEETTGICERCYDLRTNKPARDTGA